MRHPERMIVTSAVSRMLECGKVEGSEREMRDSGENHRGPVGVLVVDDQEIFRKTLRDLVAATEGLRLVGEAVNGEEALEAVERLSPTIVIMDVRMPGMGGVEATRRLTERHEGLLVLLVSVEPGDPAQLRRSGAAGFMRKQDLSPRTLRATVQAHGVA
jgi:DNA-binding NarL/FixJ family response regulator